MDLNYFLDQTLIAKLQMGGYFLMFFLMFLEGPIITFLAGVLASLGVFDIRIVLLLGWMGDIFGDMFFYCLGRYGWKILSKKTVVNTEEKRTFMSSLDALIAKNLALAMFVIKFTPYAPPIGLTYIGKSGVSMRKYFLTALALCIPIPVVAGLVGFYIGGVNQILRSYSFEMLLLWFFGAFLLLGSIIFAVKSLQKKSKNIVQSTVSSQKIGKNNTSGAKSPR